MSYQFQSSSPAMVLPAQQPDHHLPNGHYASPITNGHGSNYFGAPFTPNQSNATTLGSLAGRKRSRDDAHGPEDDDVEIEDGSTPASFAATPGESLENAPGLNGAQVFDSTNDVAQRANLVDKSNHFQLSHPKRPSVSTRKSQRMDATVSGSDDLAQLVLPPSMREATAEPLIDEATRVLGISWTRMDSTEALQIGQAAYGKWIQNHYPGLRDVKVWFENSAIPGYLVAATNTYNGQQGYYIFSNDLTEARLVTTDPAQLVPRLQMLPALHLAAPGGCIRAETAPVSAAQNETDDIQAEAVSNVDDDSSKVVEPAQPEDICTAHSMELD